MIDFRRAAGHFALLFPLTFFAPAILAQDSVSIPAELPDQLPLPEYLQTGKTVPWLYRGSDVPQDREWLFGEMQNGVRYAARKNGVPPHQVSIRIRIDAGSLHEQDAERGFAHLLEHLTFRESKYLGQAAAIPTWQRLGASFGSDTNAETSPTHTVYKLDLPNATPEALAESFKLLSGMIREPVLSPENLAAEVPIVLAEKRERGGAGQRAAEETRKVLFAGQRLAERLPIGTDETLNQATAKAVQAFHARWYRPENTMIAVAGDVDAKQLASLVEHWFGDWKVAGKGAKAPDFGDPIGPAGGDPANPVGEVSVLVEPDLPRSMTYAILRPWRPVDDTIAYNQGLLVDSLSQSIINRRLESRARAGGSYLYATVQQNDISRSSDATFVSFAPLSGDWRTALADVRGVIADAIASPPTQEEINREMAEQELAFRSSVEQSAVAAGGQLADNIVQALDIREAVAAPDVILQVFSSMGDQFTPANVLAHTRALFTGDVIRAAYVTPAQGEASEDGLRAAMLSEAKADAGARLAAKTIRFADLPPIGPPGKVTASQPLGILGIQQVQFANGVKAILWANDAEPGRVALKVRFGSGYRGFGDDDAAYIELGRSALIGSGIGELGMEELDRISTGRKVGFDFGIGDGAFTFFAQTRRPDLADQLYLFAAKLGMPRWDPNPVLRAQASAQLGYESYAASPSGVLARDLDYLMYDGDGRFKTADPAALGAATPEGFRKVWEPLLKQGPIEVLIFGDYDYDQAVDALSKTFGALAIRDPIPADARARMPSIAAPTAHPVVLRHRGDANQAAAVVAWPSGGGVAGLREGRQLEILTDLFNNRLVDAMRERAGASYAPHISSNWPIDLEGGGAITAVAQLRPEDVPIFFAAANAIALDLANNPPTADELARVTEPLKQLISRASTGNTFWLFQLEGAAQDPRRITLIRSLLADYTQTTPAQMQALARRYLAARPGWRLAVIPQGQELATKGAGKAAALLGR